MLVLYIFAVIFLWIFKFLLECACHQNYQNMSNNHHSSTKLSDEFPLICKYQDLLHTFHPKIHVSYFSNKHHSLHCACFTAGVLFQLDCALIWYLFISKLVKRWSSTKNPVLIFFNSLLCAPALIVPSLPIKTISPACALLFATGSLNPPKYQ